MMYATREQVSASLEVLNSAYAGLLIDQKIDAASRSAEGFLHRRFYPELRTILLDWPSARSGPSWQVELWDQEAIAAVAVTSGGTDITSSVILRRGDDLDEPPYSLLQIDLSTNAAFSAGSTWQRSLSAQMLFGYNDTDTSVAGAALSGAINSSTTSVTLNPSNGEYTVGIGSLLMLGTERLIVINRRMASTALTINANVTDSQAARVISSASAAQFAIGETILIDSERMRIEDIAGTNMIVTRAFDGTVLAAHSTGATIYALRLFTVRRGALGSTAASHDDAALVYVHKYPPLLNELVVAEAVTLLQQNAAGYARTIGTGPSARETAGKGLEDVRARAWQELGRKQRSRAV